MNLEGMSDGAVTRSRVSGLPTNALKKVACKVSRLNRLRDPRYQIRRGNGERDIERRDDLSHLSAFDRSCRPKKPRSDYVTGGIDELDGKLDIGDRIRSVRDCEIPEIDQQLITGRKLLIAGSSPIWEICPSGERASIRWDCRAMTAVGIGITS